MTIIPAFLIISDIVVRPPTPPPALVPEPHHLTTLQWLDLVPYLALAVLAVAGLLYLRSRRGPVPGDRAPAAKG